MTERLLRLAELGAVRPWRLAQCIRALHTSTVGSQCVTHKHKSTNTCSNTHECTRTNSTRDVATLYNKHINRLAVEQTEGR